MAVGMNIGIESIREPRAEKEDDGRTGRWNTTTSRGGTYIKAASLPEYSKSPGDHCNSFSATLPITFLAVNRKRIRHNQRLLRDHDLPKPVLGRERCLRCGM
jgi:hypothetical protein